MTAPTLSVTGAHVSQAGVLRGELLKARTLRSTLLNGLAAAGAMVLLAAVSALDFANDWDAASAAERAALDPTPSLLSGWFLAQVLIGVIGALAVTSEYASGSIAATFAAVPRRTPVLVAKLIVPAVAAAVVMLPATVVGVLVGAALLPADVAFEASDPDVLRAMVGVAVAMAGISALGTALGFLLRSTAGTIGVLVVVLFVVPGLVAGLSEELHQILPGGAIESLVTVDREAEELPVLPWPAGLAALGAWVAAAAGGAAWTLRRRDA